LYYYSMSKKHFKHTVYFLLKALRLGAYNSF